MSRLMGFALSVLIVLLLGAVFLVGEVPSLAQTGAGGASTNTSASAGIPTPTHGTFLGVPGSEVIGGTTATSGTFLGTPIPVAQVPAGTNPATTTTTTPALTDTSATAAIPFSVYYPTPGNPVIVIGANGVAPQGTSGAYPQGTTAVGTSGSTAKPAAASPNQAVGTAGLAQLRPLVADADLLREAQKRLRSAGGFEGVDVDVERGVILVTAHEVPLADRDRLFAIAREVHGAAGVMVRW